MDPTLNWELAEIVSLNNYEIKFKTINKKKKLEGNLNLKDIKWTLKQKKTIEDFYQVGDILFVKKINNIWKIKQYPKVNGGIIVINPFTGRSSGFSRWV